MKNNQFASKIKRKPSDFIVEELLALSLSTTGKFAIYRLKKINRNTLDVLAEISRRWKIPLYKFGFSGLKDKRAITTQYISIEDGPSKNLYEKDWELIFLGRREKGIEIGEAEGNLFVVKLYDIDYSRVKRALEVVKVFGFANYFGEQRFRGDLYTKKPVARYLMEGDFWGALKEYFTQSGNRFQKKRLERLWGKWSLFLEEAYHLSEQEKVAIRVLRREKDARRAFRAMPKNLKLLFLFSYQSRLWNRILKRLVKKYTENFCVPFVVEGKLCFYKSGRGIDRLLDLEIPYISESACQNIPSWLEKEIKRVMLEEGLTQEKLSMEIEGLKLFSTGMRKAVVIPEKLEILERGRGSIRLKFILPSGSYATVMLRKLVYFTP